MEKVLEKRVRYFLTSHYRGRNDVRQTMSFLEGLGRLVLIGGMLRDLAIFGNAGFRSDLDFVIDPHNQETFDLTMASIGARKNRFGGYALPFHKWQVDVWSLNRTWAHTAGHVQVKTFDDLKNATFFRCDAILYDVSKRKIDAKEGYFEDLQRKILEVNLLPNPNPKGNAVRALRYAMLKDFFWGPQLVRFFFETVEKSGWNSLAEVEMKSFRSQYISMVNHKDILASLHDYLSNDRQTPFDPRAHKTHDQLELNLPLKASAQVPMS